MDPLQTAAAIGSGVIVGFSLGLIGGGRSILAVPLLLYVVKDAGPAGAIGTSALAVAVNAFANLVPHARAGHVRWRPALMFAVAGLVGAFVGSSIGKIVDGHKLLILFALLMLVIAGMMLRGRKADAGVAGAPRLVNSMAGLVHAIGLGVGTIAGFYGIGGGFLCVPGLMLATGMPTIAAIGSSLVAVGAFGMTTAVNYAVSGLVEWPIALLFIAGGIAGGWLGALLAKRLSAQRQTLTRVLGCMLIVVAAYMLYRSFT